MADGVWLRAGPNGRSVGFMSLPLGEGHLSVAVLPKPWAAGARVMSVDAARSTHVTLHELDYLHVRAPLPALVGLAARQVDDPAQALLTPCRPPDRLPVPASSAGGFAALLDLAALSERARVTPIGQGDERPEHHPALRLLLFDRFLAEFERQAGHARPRYVERDEVLTAPRGRLDGAGLAMAVHTGAPAVRCRYDELTYDSPPLQVIRAALTVIARTRPPAAVAHLDPGLAERAARHVAALPGVAPLPRSNAAHTGRHLRLTGRERHWSDALTQAGQVLADGALSPRRGADEHPAWSLVLPTEKLWERILAAALPTVVADLRNNADNTLADGVEVDAPWSAVGVDDERYPDFVGTVGGEVTVIDAKYKLLDGRPGSADAYQLFAYSHLTRLRGDPARRAAVIGVTPGPASVSALVRSPETTPPFPLHVLSVAFPGRDHVRHRTAWSAYLTELAAEIRMSLRG